MKGKNIINDIILQSETHNDDFGIVFIQKKDGIYCAIDWIGGEKLFKLNFIEKNYYMKCPICKGNGEIESPKHINEIRMKRVTAQSLRKNGYSIRQIMRFIGYKSPNSVKILLEQEC